MNFTKQVKLVITDIHFLIPLGVLLAGIALLVALH
jgi:hypothetical protein